MLGKVLYQCRPVGWEQNKGQKWRKSAKRESRCIKVVWGSMLMTRLSREKRMMMMKLFSWMLTMMKKLTGFNKTSKRKTNILTAVATSIHRNRELKSVVNQKGSPQKERNKMIHQRITMVVVRMRDHLTFLNRMIRCMNLKRSQPYLSWKTMINSKWTPKKHLRILRHSTTREEVAQ